MAQPTDVPSDLLAALRDILSRHGTGVIADRSRLFGLLRDHAPNDMRGTRLLMTALDAGIPGRFLAAGGSPSPLEIGQETAKMAEEFGSSPDLARAAVETWAKAIAGLPAPAPAASGEASAQTPREEAAPSSAAAGSTAVASTSSATPKPLPGSAAPSPKPMPLPSGPGPGPLPAAPTGVRPLPGAPAVQPLPGAAPTVQPLPTAAVQQLPGTAPGILPLPGQPAGAPAALPHDPAHHRSHAARWATIFTAIVVLASGGLRLISSLTGSEGSRSPVAPVDREGSTPAPDGPGPGPSPAPPSGGSATTTDEGFPIATMENSPTFKASRIQGDQNTLLFPFGLRFGNRTFTYQAAFAFTAATATGDGLLKAAKGGAEASTGPVKVERGRLNDGRTAATLLGRLATNPISAPSVCVTFIAGQARDRIDLSGDAGFFCAYGLDAGGSCDVKAPAGCGKLQ